MRFTRPQLCVLSAPSGTGKSTLLAELLKLFQGGLTLSVSYTTRAPRPGEIEGQDYFFIDKKEFTRRIHGGDFLEWAEVHGNFYGTGKNQIQASLAQGQVVLLDIDVQGALQLMDQAALEAQFIFLSPPSLAELKRRLKKRATETKAQIRVRLENAKEEMKYRHFYHYQLKNEHFTLALLEFATLLLKLAGPSPWPKALLALSLDQANPRNASLKLDQLALVLPQLF